jgi:hypothetical protein
LHRREQCREFRDLRALLPFKDWFVRGKKSGDPSSRAQSKEEEHAGKELWVQIFSLGLLFLYASNVLVGRWKSS